MSANYSERPVLPAQIMGHHYYEKGVATPAIHMAFEADVTALLERQAEYQRRTRQGISLTIYLTYVAARAIAESPDTRSFLRGRKFMEFEDVDMFVLFEKTLPTGLKAPRGHIFKNANKRSFADLNAEFRDVLKASDAPTAKARDRLARLPGPIRRLLVKRIFRNPLKFRAMMGSAFVTSVGFFAGSQPSFGFPVSGHPVGLTMGTIYDGSSVIDGNVVPRKKMCLTGTVDHRVVYGASGARLVKRVVEMIEDCVGLDDGFVEDALARRESSEDRLPLESTQMAGHLSAGPLPEPVD